MGIRQDQCNKVCRIDVWECGCFLDTYCEHQIYDRNPDGTINIVKCGYEPKDEPTTEDCSTVDKDINVRSKDEPKLSEIPTSKCHYEPTDEPQERSRHGVQVQEITE